MHVMSMAIAEAHVKAGKKSNPASGLFGCKSYPREITYVDIISSEEVARRLEELGYKEEAERIEKVYGEVPPFSRNL